MFVFIAVLNEEVLKFTENEVERATAEMQIMEDTRNNEVSTGTDIVQYLREKRLINHANSFDSWLMEASPTRRNLWISHGDSSRYFPAEACREKDTKTINNGGESTITNGTQTYLEAINREVSSAGCLYLESADIPGTYNESTAIKFVRTSDPHDNQKSVSFRNRRRPDLVLYRSGCSGAYAITSLGDAKPFDGLDDAFSEAQIGHVLDMGIELMSHVQPWRSFLIVFLTDTHGDGWTIYLSLLMLSLDDLGYSEMSIAGVQAMDLVGSGVGFSGKKKRFVFSGKVEASSLKAAAHEDEDGEEDSSSSLYMLKVFFPGDDDAFEREKKNLLRLADSAYPDDHPLYHPEELRRKHLPRLIRWDLMTNESCLHVLMVSPIALKVSPCRDGHRVCSRHILQLVDVVEFVHTTTNLVHRDIQPDNIFLSLDQKHIILGGWGAAADRGSEGPPNQGTYGVPEEERPPPSFSPDSSLLAVVPAFEDDLVAVVKSAYSMLFNEPAPGKGENLEEFWTSRLMTAPFWATAVRASTAGNYDLLRNHLKEIFRINI
eukprot:gene31492-40899_t